MAAPVVHVPRLTPRSLRSSSRAAIRLAPSSGRNPLHRLAAGIFAPMARPLRRMECLALRGIGAWRAWLAWGQGNRSCAQMRRASSSLGPYLIGTGGLGRRVASSRAAMWRLRQLPARPPPGFFQDVRADADVCGKARAAAHNVLRRANPRDAPTQHPSQRARGRRSLSMCGQGDGVNWRARAYHLGGAPTGRGLPATGLAYYGLHVHF